MVNRYIPGSRLTDKQVEAVLWSVCALQTIEEAAKAASISERSAGEMMRKLRSRISMQADLFAEVGLQAEWPGEASPYWARLHGCIFSCPSEIRSEMPKDRLGKGILMSGDRGLCADCPHQGIEQSWPMLLRTLNHLKTAHRGVPLEGFKDLFLTVLLYDRYRTLETEQALTDPEAMKRLGSSRNNHMTKLYSACCEALRR